VHALQVAEDLGAEIEHDLLAGPLHKVGLDELEREGERERGEVEEAEFGDAGEGSAAEMAAEPAGIAGGSEIGVDGDENEVRTGDVRCGFEQCGYG